MGRIMEREPRLFDIDVRVRELSAKGDDLERVTALVVFQAFRPELDRPVLRTDRSRGGRPPYDHALMEGFAWGLVGGADGCARRGDQAAIPRSEPSQRRLETAAAGMVRGEGPVRHHVRRPLRRRVGATPPAQASPDSPPCREAPVRRVLGQGSW